MIRPFIVALAALVALPSFEFPGGGGGVGFDDLGFAPVLHKVLVPGGQTGKLALIDPETYRADLIGGFSEGTSYPGGHSEGITSADAGAGAIFVTDRSNARLNVVDPAAHKITAFAALASGPDYVRYVAPTNEVWVTQPDDQRIEIFALGAGKKPVHDGFIAVEGGPEALADAGDRAFTNTWRGETLAIDPKKREIVGRWTNGCKGSRGIALDEKRGFLFVACAEGGASVLDIKSGKILGRADSGGGVDVIAYNRQLKHLYLPGARSATMTTVAIASDGTVKTLDTIKTARGAHCAAVDDRDQVYVCDPYGGRILIFRDSGAGP